MAEYEPKLGAFLDALAEYQEALVQHMDAWWIDVAKQVLRCTQEMCCDAITDGLRALHR